jgi:acyl-coenzyme A thioesterase PaaI-like protein
LRGVAVGRTFGVVDIDVTDQDGKLVAVGRGTFGT